jgi:hypothetical protein
MRKSKRSSRSKKPTLDASPRTPEQQQDLEEFAEKFDLDFYAGSKPPSEKERKRDIRAAVKKILERSSH